MSTEPKDVGKFYKAGQFADNFNKIYTAIVVVIGAAGWCWGFVQHYTSKSCFGPDQEVQTPMTQPWRADSDGFVLAYSEVTTEYSDAHPLGMLAGYTGKSNSFLIKPIAIGHVSTGYKPGATSIQFPVRKNDFWIVSNTTPAANASTTVRFVPFQR